MDGDIREELHVELCPCSNEEFLARYLERDPDFKKILDEIISSIIYRCWGSGRPEGW